MAGTRQEKRYERVRAELLAEAEALGLVTRGAPLDPVLELLINGFARQLERVYEEVDQALEYSRRTLLRNYFGVPFLSNPAQTVVAIELKRRAQIDPGMRITWKETVRGQMPEYRVVDAMEMVPMRLALALYCSGASVWRLTWGEEGGMGVEHYELGSGRFDRPELLLALESPEEALDSGSLSILVHPNENSLAGVFPGDSPAAGFSEYLGMSSWFASSGAGAFDYTMRLPLLMRTEDVDRWSRCPTEGDFLAKMQAEHLYAFAMARFEPGRTIARSAPPEILEDLAAAGGGVADILTSDSYHWLALRFPYEVVGDPREMLSVVEVNARLAVGYKRDPRDRFNYRSEDFNVRTELFEFGLSDRPGAYCSTYGSWVVAELTDQAGNVYPYVFEESAAEADRWFTLEASPDDVTLMVHLPRRRVPEVGYLDLVTGRIMAEVANTPVLDVISPLPANGLDYPEVSGLRMLVPARGGGDGFGGMGEGPDSFDRGAHPVLDRQYARAAAYLRTRGRVVSLPDMISFLMASDARIVDVEAEPAALFRSGGIVPGLKLVARFAEQESLPREEMEAACRMATARLQALVPVGTFVEVVPGGGE